MAWIRRLRTAPVTLGLIIVNLSVYAVMAGSSRHVASFDTATLIDAGACVSGVDGPISHWRWLTAAFIHVNLLHIAMNMWVLAQIGVISEQAIGPGLYAVTYVVTGTLGNVLSTARASAHGQPFVSAGASGAIMGLIGMAAMFAWRSGQKAAARALAFNIVFVLGVGLSLSARGIGLVDNAAHIGGLIAGAAIGLARVQMRTPFRSGTDAVAIGLSAAATAAAFAIVLLLPG